MDDYLGQGDKIRQISPGSNLGHRHSYNFYPFLQQSHTPSKNRANGERRGFASKAQGLALIAFPLWVVLNFLPILS